MTEYIIHNFSIGTWYQNVAIYTLIAVLVYANIFLIKLGEKKKVKA